MSTPDTRPDLEDLLRAALTARAELVQPEDLAPLATVVPLRPRWQSPWVLLATAAVVLLVLGVVLQGVGGRPRSDDLAPEPDAPRLELPADVGRDWDVVDQSSPARLDLDGDGVKETVEFLGEPTKKYDGRIRLQTTLSTTGAEAYGIADLDSTIGTNALPAIDADGDGDQELVLYRDDPDAVGGGGYPLVFDLRDGLLVRAPVDDAELLVRGQVPVPGEATEFYDLVRIQDYQVEDGALVSSRSVNAFASADMALFVPRTYVLDTWTWTLGADGVLRHGDPACLLEVADRTRPCGDSPADAADLPLVPAVSSIGVGESATFTRGTGFTARIDAGDPPVLVVDGPDGSTLRHDLDVADPRIPAVQPESIFYDGAAVVVTSESDPRAIEVLVQRGDRLVALEPGGEVPLEDEGGVRTWLSETGSLYSAVAAGGDAWVVWQWLRVSDSQMAAVPWGTTCFSDVDAAVTTPC